MRPTTARSRKSLLPTSRICSSSTCIPCAKAEPISRRPIAHNGIIYLANTQGILQAIDGATGKVIWETKVQGTIAPRGIAIYQDKIYFANGNFVSAVDARNGKSVWSTEIGHSNTSGPIVAKGKVIEGMGGCGQFTRTTSAT